MGLELGGWYLGNDRKFFLGWFLGVVYKIGFCDLVRGVVLGNYLVW